MRPVDKRAIANNVGLIVVVSACLILSGCDAIENVRNYLSGEEPEEKTASATRESSRPSEEPQTFPQNTLARVGDWYITDEQFENRLQALKEVVPDYDITDPESRRLVLDELIRQQLLVEEAEKTGLANDQDIKAAIEEFRRTLIVRQMVQDITEGVEFTEGDALQFYNQRKDELVEPEEWRVREIVVGSQEQANDILIEVLKGADFAEMARQHSTAETAEEGGDLGFITQVEFPQMLQALLPLEPGDVSSVFKGPDGFYIVKLEEKRGGEPLAFDEIKEEIISSQSVLKQQQVILDYIEDLESRIKVEINEEML